jgi:hypothetical protein
MTQPQTSTYPYRPFQPERIKTLDPGVISELEDSIWKMGPGSVPKDYTDGPKPVRVEEQYEIHERHALPFTNTAPSYWDIVTVEPKQYLLIADGADVFFDLNRQISTDSPKNFNGGSFTGTAKGTSRIWVQGVTSSGTLRIVVFKR